MTANACYDAVSARRTRFGKCQRKRTARAAPQARCRGGERIGFALRLVLAELGKRRVYDAAACLAFE